MNRRNFLSRLTGGVLAATGIGQVAKAAPVAKPAIQPAVELMMQTMLPQVVALQQQGIAMDINAIVQKMALYSGNLNLLSGK